MNGLLIKPSKTAKTSIHSVSRCSFLIYSMFLLEKVLVDTFGSDFTVMKVKIPFWPKIKSKIVTLMQT